jgi:hypothetical protein
MQLTKKHESLLKSYCYRLRPRCSAGTESAFPAEGHALNAMGAAASWSQMSTAIVAGTCTASIEQGTASANFCWATEGKEFR